MTLAWKSKKEVKLGVLCEVVLEVVVEELKLYPVDLGQKLPRSQRGLPRLTKAREPMLYLAELSKSYGTEISVDEEGVGTVRLRN